MYNIENIIYYVYVIFYIVTWWKKDIPFHQYYTQYM